MNPIAGAKRTRPTLATLALLATGLVMDALSRGVPRTAYGMACGTLPDVLGEAEAVVLEVKPWDVHGVGYVDVTVIFADRRVETARLGAEGVPERLLAGDRVLVTSAMNVIVSMRRAPAEPESGA